MDQLQSWAQIIAALGVGTLLLEGGKAIWRWMSGRVGRERDAVSYERKLRQEADTRFLEEQRRADELDRKLDAEIALRRRIVGIAARYERRLIAAGVDTHELEIWPEETTLPRDQISALRRVTGEEG